MSQVDSNSTEGLSHWWRIAALSIIVVELGLLGWIVSTAYGTRVAPPIPGKMVGLDHQALFTRQDIEAGQQAFLEFNLMDHGTLWGHGAYVGPDFTAAYLHQLALNTEEYLRRQGKALPTHTHSGTDPADELSAQVHALLSKNRYDAASDTLWLTPPEVETCHQQIDYWRDYFRGHPSGLEVPALTESPERMHSLVAFFAWSAWAAAADRPGVDYSYTNNFPYDPTLGNGPDTGVIVWSALSLIALLAAIAGILLAFGRFDYLGWHRAEGKEPPGTLPGAATPSQRALLKFCVVVAGLLLVQTLVGGAVAHYRAAPDFYGWDLASAFPTNVLRGWHLQLAILWIATAYIAGGAFLSVTLGGREPARQKGLIQVLFWALVILVVGSLAGQWLGARGDLGKTWFWLGNQGWEYLELGRLWQYLLIAGFILWGVLLLRAAWPALRDRAERELTMLFLGAAFAIPVFYLPAVFFGSTTHFTVVDTWRFWIIHLWVEGFFELFATIMVAVTFFKLGLVSRKVATRVIYLDAILFLGAGILGTGHHWYWTGQSRMSMALSATFSAMEVVPLILLTLDAAAFVGLTRGRRSMSSGPGGFPHRLTFFFLIAVGVWNFIGAGIFGFLINLPIVSYYEAGTNLTANHGHGALMGVFGMLAIALVVLILRHVSDDAHWQRVGRLVKVSLWGLNIGLAGMILLSLFPSGVIQMWDVAHNGYWHARSPEFLHSTWMQRLEWLRLPADGIFIVVGVLPLLAAAGWTYLRYRKPPASL